LGQSPVQPRGIYSGIPGAEVHASSQAPGPDQSGSALLYGRRPCTQGSAHSSRQAGG
jgi:hypothetical protein